MFEPVDINALVERRGAEAVAEIRQMADAALRALGFTQAWINRSRGQRARFARRRQTKGESQ